MTILTLTVAGLLATASPGRQAAPAPQAQATAAGTTAVAPPAADSWKQFSSSAIRAYLIDTHQVKKDGDVAGVTIAQVPLNPSDPADKSYKRIDMEIQCATQQSRVISETPYDATGAAQDREDIGETFGSYSPGGMDSAVANLLCEDNEPAGAAWPSITAFIDGGRK